MNFEKLSVEDRLGHEYTNHPVFKELSIYSEFYDSLSFSIMNWIPNGTNSFFNLDTYIISSIKGTIDSIREILIKGRINDSYSLVRKYFDSTMINIYTNLFLQDNFSFDNLIVKQIDNWRKGIESIPEYRIISQYIKESEKLKPITELLKKDGRYKEIRNRCNDNTHYNFFHNVLLNDNELYNEDRVKHLDTISYDIQSLFIQHFAYLLYLNDHYFMSSDYHDYLDLGFEPEEDSQYWVAPFIKKVFDEIIQHKRPDIAKEIIHNTNMQIE